MRLKDLVHKLVLISFGVVLSITVAEILLRLFLPLAYSMEVEYVPDGHLGTRLQPNKVYTLRSGGIATINNMGFRGAHEMSRRKPPGTVRIVALGGSSTFSYHIDDSDTWVAVLERRLQERFGHRVEAINAGVPGYSAFESKINYLYRIRQLDPDIVIVYHTWNDMKYLHRIERGDYPMKGTYSGYGPLKTFLRNFQIAWRVRSFVNNVIKPYQRENAFGSGDTVGKTVISDGGPAHAWIKQNYDDLAILLLADGVTPIFATQGGLLSAENIVDPGVRAVIYTEFVNLPFSDMLSQWLAIGNIIEESARRHDICFVDLYEQVPHDRAHFSDHVHLTEQGNARVAAAFFGELSTNPKVRDVILSAKP